MAVARLPAPLLAPLLAAFFLFGNTAPPARADVTLPAFFSDHMVLQRDLPNTVWGWAAPGENVTVRLATESRSTQTDPAGRWRVELGPLPAGAPTALTVQGQNTLVIQDVLLGEVWMCAGQSNMAMSVAQAQNAPQEKAAAQYPTLRMFTVTSGASHEPQTRCTGTWEVCSPATVERFSAMAYFFGRTLHQTLGTPVGLIHASTVNGSPIEAWTSLPAMAQKPELQTLLSAWEKEIALYAAPETAAKFEAETAAWKLTVEKAKAENRPAPRAPARAGRSPKDQSRPGNLFNGKIAPLAGYPIRGTVWYQGETNTSNGALYATQLPLLVQDWRTAWGRDTLPFIWAQLPGYGRRTEQPVETSGWALIRDAMRRSLAVPHTAMSVNLDLGEETDLHPKNKQEVGRRLALCALANVYGKDLLFSGPLYEKHEIHGGDIRVSFRHAQGGLVARDGALRGFAVAGADRKWVKAEGTLRGDQVIVSSAEVAEPQAVRYGWANYPDGNLTNASGLPASPFRTDSW
jgi:sialate O-acetylesterase